MSAWKAAMWLRHWNPTSILDKAAGVGGGPGQALSGFVEVETVDELRLLEGDADGMWRESLLLRERIFGAAEHDHTMADIKEKRRIFFMERNIRSYVKLILHALDFFQFNLDPLHPFTLDQFDELTNAFMFAEAGIYDIIVRSSWICYVFDRADVELNRALTRVRYGRAATDEEKKDTDDLLVNLLNLMALLCRRSADLSDVETCHFKDDVSHVAPMNVRGCEGETLLHIACSPATALLYLCARFSPLPTWPSSRCSSSPART